MLAQLVAEEVQKIKRDSSKAVKMSKRSAEIISTSLCEKVAAIFIALDADKDGIISSLDLEKSLSGNLYKVFRPLIKIISVHPKPMDYPSFESNFRQFLRVDQIYKNLSNEDRKVIENLARDKSKSPHKPVNTYLETKSKSKTPKKENIPKIDLKKVQQSSGKKVLSPLRERTIN